MKTNRSGGRLRFSFFLRASLHEMLSELSVARDCSMSQVVNDILADYRARIRRSRIVSAKIGEKSAASNRKSDMRAPARRPKGDNQSHPAIPGAGA